MGGTLRIGTWKVKTLNKIGKLENLREEVEALKADIIGLSETRYTCEGTVRLEGFKFIYSDGQHHEHGVGFMFTTSLEKHILGYLPDSDRNIMIKLKSKPFDISNIQTYASRTTHSDEDTEAYYEEIAMMLKEVKIN